MPLTEAQRPRWDRIDTVLLDLDGTLLDLEFDNHFWRETIPAAYAVARGITPEAARATLMPKFRSREGTLDWYCIEHWSRELGLDVAGLHRQESGRIAWLPGARQFLARVRGMGKRLALVTNAHPQTLRIKDERTAVAGYFDALFSSHTFHAPKESPVFWQAMRAVEPFDQERTMFVDDSAPVLRAARAAGVRWIYAVRRAGAGGGGSDQEFCAIDGVAEL